MRRLIDSIKDAPRDEKTGKLYLSTVLTDNLLRQIGVDE